MTKNNKEKTIINSLAGVMAVITILAIFAVVILRQTAAQEEKDQKVAQAMQQIQQEQEEQKSQPQPVQQEASAVQFELPQEMKAAQVSPGREFLSELAPAIEQAQLRLSGEVLQQEQQSVQPDVLQKQSAPEKLENRDSINTKVFTSFQRSALKTRWSCFPPT